MFDAQCDVAALVYTEGEDPDKVLHEFACGLKANGHRAVGIVQPDMIAVLPLLPSYT